MALAVSPHDPMVRNAEIQVRAKYPERTLDDVTEVQNRIMPGTRAFIVRTHCVQHPEHPCTWMELAEYFPPTGRWLLLDYPQETLMVSVASAREFLLGHTIKVERDLSTDRSIFHAKMEQFLEREREREERT